MIFRCVSRAASVVSSRAAASPPPPLSLAHPEVARSGRASQAPPLVGARRHLHRQHAQRGLRGRRRQRQRNRRGVHAGLRRPGVVDARAEWPR
eukprot:1151124-Prymnesium_polylepis.1